MVKNSGHANGSARPLPVKAIAATSGGLDSIVAAGLVARLGVEVLLLHVRHFFSASERKSTQIQHVADQLGLPLRIVDASEEHLEAIRHPKFGYGRGMNPCVDCRIFLLKVARRVMEEEGAQFVITGEVLGQRPKSQQLREMTRVSEETGLGDRLLRPLSANLLPDTLPVKEGWLRREDLLWIHGRTRHEQMAMAAAYGITDYPQPAGGCLLTERTYAARVRDAFDHLGRDRVGLDQFRLLGIGRHFRLSDGVKVVVGRNQDENVQLDDFAEGRTRLEPTTVMGPTSLVEGTPTSGEIALAAALAARYCDVDAGESVSFEVRDAGGSRTLEARALDRDDPRISAWRIG